MFTTKYCLAYPQQLLEDRFEVFVATKNELMDVPFLVTAPNRRLRVVESLQRLLYLRHS